MCLFKKIFRENISSVLFVIGLVVSCFVLINIGDLLGKINKENKSYNGYNNIINIDIFYPYMISNENTDNNLINDNYNDVIMGVLANTSKGNVYIDIEINVNNEVEKKEATLVFKKNEKIIMECKSECDYSIKNGIVIGEDIYNFTKEIDGQRVIFLNENIMPVIGVLKDNTVTGQDTRIFLFWDNCDENVREYLFPKGCTEPNSLSLRSNEDISSQYEQLSRELAPYGFDVSVVEASYEGNEQNYLYIVYNTLFLFGALLFSLFTCFVVADLWIYGRKKELILRRAYGYSMAKIATTILFDVFKLYVVALILALVIQLLYELAIGDNPFRGQLIIEIVTIISGMLIFIILIALSLIEKVRKNTIVKGLGENENN